MYWREARQWGSTKTRNKLWAVGGVVGTEWRHGWYLKNWKMALLKVFLWRLACELMKNIDDFTLILKCKKVLMKKKYSKKKLKWENWNMQDLIYFFSKQFFRGNLLQGLLPFLKSAYKPWFSKSDMNFSTTKNFRTRKSRFSNFLTLCFEKTQVIRKSLCLNILCYFSSSQNCLKFWN